MAIPYDGPDPNRAAVRDAERLNGACVDCGNRDYHAIDCPLNVERSEGSHSLGPWLKPSEVTSTRYSIPDDTATPTTLAEALATAIRAQVDELDWVGAGPSDPREASLLAADLFLAHRAMQAWLRDNTAEALVAAIHVNTGSGHDNAMAWSEGHTAGYEEGIRANDAALVALADELSLRHTSTDSAWHVHAAVIAAARERLNG